MRDTPYIIESLEELFDKHNFSEQEMVDIWQTVVDVTGAAMHDSSVGKEMFDQFGNDAEDNFRQNILPIIRKQKLSKLLP